ncbi:unnamed protein product [Rhizophagus irregularis]|nr:unnamed protein product [Rhizophagus irregularis]
MKILFILNGEFLVQRFLRVQRHSRFKPVEITRFAFIRFITYLLLLSHLILTKQINSKTRLEKSRYDDKVIHSTKPSSITSNIYSHFMINPFSNYWISMLREFCIIKVKFSKSLHTNNLNLSSTNSLNFFWRISMSSRSSSIFMRVGRVGEFEAKKYNVLRSNSIKHNDAKDNNNKYSHDLDLEFFFRILLIEHMMFSVGPNFTPRLSSFSSVNKRNVRPIIL